MLSAGWRRSAPRAIRWRQSGRWCADAEDDRDRRGRGFSHERCLREAGGGNHGHALADEVGHQRGQAIVSAVQPVVVDHHVLALDVAGFVEAFKERSDNARRDIGRPAVDEADDRYRCCARARSGQAAAAPPSTAMTSRRPMSDMSLPPAWE